MTAQLDGLARPFEETAQRPPQWAGSLAERIEVLRAQVAPVAELHSLWADLGTVSENVEHALPQLRAVCDTVGRAIQALHLTPQGVGLGGYRERYVTGVLGAGVRGKAGRG